MASGDRLRISRLLWCVSWPIIIPWSRGSFDTVLTIHTFYKRETQSRQFWSSNRNLNRSRYFRLMALAAIEILCTIPISTYVIVLNAKKGILPWMSWEHVHSNYSRVMQVPAFVWKENRDIYNGLEMFRWLLVACSLIFFAFFGFADEARQHYRLVYTSLASRIGISTSSATLHGSSHAYVMIFNYVTRSRLTGLSSARRLSLT